MTSPHPEYWRIEAERELANAIRELRLLFDEKSDRMRRAASFANADFHVKKVFPRTYDSAEAKRYRALGPYEPIGAKCATHEERERVALSCIRELHEVRAMFRPASIPDDLPLTDAERASPPLARR
jgi:hypothetical protein